MSDERRSSERIGVAIDAVCRREGECWNARISNISAGGCCIELPWKVLERGDKLAIELDDDFVLPARVAWVGTRRAGLAFASPLYVALIEEFAEKMANAA